MIVALVLGLLVGAGVIGGIWFAGSRTAAAPPPVQVGLSSFPDSILGLDRDDLTQHDPDLARLLAQGSAAQVTKAYGGAGFQISYGGQQGQFLQVLAVNAVAPGQLVFPDAELLSLGFLSPGTWLAAPSTATVSCTMAGTGGAVKDAQALVKAKTDLLAATDGTVSCRRSDPGRPFSVQMTYSGSFDVSLTDRAARMATAIDTLWQGMAA